MKESAVEFLSNVLFVILFILFPFTWFVGLAYVAISDFLDELKSK